MERYTAFSVCAKCGCTAQSAEFKRFWDDEWIARKCQNCGYTWMEKPLDAA